MIQKRKKFLDILKKNAGLVYLSCEKCGITAPTYYNWLRDDPSFAEAVKSINEGMLDFAEGALFEKIKNKDLTAIIFFLKTKGRERGYQEKLVTETTIKSDIAGKPLDATSIEIAKTLFTNINANE